MSEITRCIAITEVAFDCIKRCIRNDGHNESHIWVEASNRSDGLPILVTWDISGVQHFEYQPIQIPEIDTEDVLVIEHPSWCKCQRVCGGDQ